MFRTNVVWSAIVVFIIAALMPWQPLVLAQENTVSTEVIVVGAGAAGLIAAMQASEDGAEVILLEQMRFPGGSTLLAAGGICASNLDIQLEHGITEDSPEIHAQDMLKLGQYKNDPELVRVVTENVTDGVNWLRGYGLTLINRANRPYGATYPRAYRTEGGGPALVSTLTNAAESLGVDIRLQTEAVALVREENGPVTGVIAKLADGSTVEFIAERGVVLATGGFAWNQDLINEFIPHLNGIATNNSVGSTGSGITMAREIGAALRDMELTRIAPLGVMVNNQWASAPNELIENGALFVNVEGLAVDAADKNNEDLAATLLGQTDHTSYLVFDQAVFEATGETALARFVDTTALLEGSVESVAATAGIDATSLKATLAAASLSDDQIYALRIQPYIHTTMGGLTINTKAQVLDVNGNIIPGLYAAGEVTGGIHGAEQGNALSDCIAFGRVAGRNVAQQ